jgi:phage-related protein
MQQAGSAAGGFKSKLAGLAKAGAVAGIAALTAAVKIGVEEWAEAEKVTAQTEAVLKSTGGAAKVTAKEVEKLAESLMKKSGVDDEAIQSGENVLLTFTNIRNEAGKGNDIFNQTTAAALDMSVALGTDMKTASMQLGKALNDPVKGLSKLTKQGVTFTDAQKAQVKAMQESGDVAGAQKIILAELTKEFGGSAEAAGKTLPGQLKILQQEFSNVAGALVGELIPPITALFEFFTKHKTAVIALVAVLGTMATIVYTIGLATKAWAAAQAIAEAATVAWTAVQWLLNAALTANPIGLVVVAIGALVVALVIAYKKSDKFKEIVDAAFNAVWDIAKKLFNWFKSNWPLLLAILVGPIGIAVLLIVRHWDTIRDTTIAAVNAVKGAIVNAWNAVKSATVGAWDAVAGAITDTIAEVKRVLNALASWVTGFAHGVLSAAVNKVKAVWDNIADGARDAVGAVKDAFNGVITFLGGVVDRVRSVANQIASAIKAPINSVISAWNGLSFTIPRITIPSKTILGKKIGGGSFGGNTISFPNVSLLAKGGVVATPTLAMVGEGQGREIVTPEKLLRQIVGERAVEVRVFIGDRELTSIVRTEIVDANTGLARGLLAGGAG